MKELIKDHVAALQIPAAEVQALSPYQVVKDPVGYTLILSGALVPDTLNAFTAYNMIHLTRDSLENQSPGLFR